ncbi:MAG: 3-dehydroquinate synthase [Treponema sp.]|jgi:3-dehydroquinate synthase|nr:3-dehydroquinate synthase [Treponema sp.]
MSRRSLAFNFGGFPQDIRIRGPVPPLALILEEFEALSGDRPPTFLLICDEHTLPLARTLSPLGPCCVLASGEANKNWAAVERIIAAAAEAGLGRDSLFIACGGGVVSDLAGFAASVYMRGVRLCNVSTSLLGMVDAALGGKTGFDLLGLKNLAGTFYPARLVYLPVESLRTLPPAEWKSGFAELIKTAVLDGEDFFRLLETIPGGPEALQDPEALEGPEGPALEEAVYRAAAYKGRIVEEDPRETGGRRALLNLGHSFAHALESSAGLGRISHGEAVAWGLARSCELGLALGITGAERAGRITALLKARGYETAAPHPLMGPSFMEALKKDKKNRGGRGVFIVPAAGGAEILREAPAEELLRQIVKVKS